MEQHKIYTLEDINKIITEIQIDNKIDVSLFLNKLKNEDSFNQNYFISNEDTGKFKEKLLSDLKNGEFKTGDYVKITKICEKIYMLMGNKTDIIGFYGDLIILNDKKSIAIRDRKNKINFIWSQDDNYIFEMILIK